MQGRIETAIHEGDFGRAAGLIQEQLDKDPYDRAAAGGYYCTRYWQNRKDVLDKEAPGKRRATYLLNEWDAFEYEINERRIADLPIVTEIMRAVFSLAAQNLRTAFLKEGVGAVNFDVLKKMGFCLLRCGDYANAYEVLEYARAQTGDSAYLAQMLGETADKLGRKSDAIAWYREALVEDPKDLDPQSIRADFAARLVKSAQEAGYDEKSVLDGAFVIGSVNGELCEFRPLTKAKLEALLADLAYVENELQRKGSELRDKMRIYLIKKYLYLLDYFAYRARSADWVADLSERLRKVDEHVYKSWKENYQRQTKNNSNYR